MSLVIKRALEFGSDIDRVWRALTDPSEIGKWFSDRAEFDATPGSLGWEYKDGPAFCGQALKVCTDAAAAQFIDELPGRSDLRRC